MAAVEGALRGLGSTGERGSLRTRLNLTRELALTQFKLKYTGSALGYLWSLLKPLMIFTIMYIVFARLLKLNSSTPNYTIQLLVGIVLWQFFVETVSIAIGVVVTNTALIKKASFSRPTLVIASSVSAFMTFAINLTMIILIAAPFGRADLGWRSLALFPLIVELYALILGLSLMLSALFVFYRDLGHVWEVGSQLLFFGSAIVYPLSSSILGDKVKLLALNPVAQIVQDVRHCIVTRDAPWTEVLVGGRLYAIPIGIVAATALIGYFTFKKLSSSFAEQL